MFKHHIQTPHSRVPKHVFAANSCTVGSWYECLSTVNKTPCCAGTRITRQLSELSAGRRGPHSPRRGAEGRSKCCVQRFVVTRAVDVLSLIRFRIAVMLYTRTIEENPSNAVYYSNRAFAHTKLENYGAAVEDATKAIELDPDYLKVRRQQLAAVLISARAHIESRM
eukprot:2998388-Pyramimonas_sp.AAC.1